jgi:hypothetical protein
MALTPGVPMDACCVVLAAGGGGVGVGFLRLTGGFGFSCVWGAG